MHTHKITRTICREEVLSRLPSLFAYLDEGTGTDGTMTLHGGADSDNGSYGHIVENLQVPCGVSLCVYTLTEDDPLDGIWDDHTTLPIGSDAPIIGTDDDDDYIRLVYAYEYTANTGTVDEEDYTAVDTLDDPVTATSQEHVSLEIPPCDHIYYDKETYYNYYKKECIIREKETYSYRYLIKTYHAYREAAGHSHPFIMFMERAIGRIVTDFQAIGVTEEECPMIPPYIYLAEVHELLGCMEAMERSCAIYHNRDEQDPSWCCDCETFEAMGGHRMILWLKTLEEQRQAISDEYLCYAQQRGHDVSFNIDALMTQSFNDLGYQELYVNPFIPGNAYQDGELVTYEGRTYLCMLDNFKQGGVNYPYIYVNNTYYRLDVTQYNEVSYLDVVADELPTTVQGGYLYIRYKDGLYLWDGSAYQSVDVTRYCTGVTDPTTGLTVFDPQHFVLLTEVAKAEGTTVEESEGWYSDDNPYGDHMLFYVTTLTIPNSYVADNIRVGGLFYHWDGSSYVLNNDGMSSFPLEGGTESYLKGFRRYASYTNIYNETETPDDGDDWLFYYREGYIPSYKTETDSYGNIKRESGLAPVVGSVVTDLRAYGDVLISIQADATDHTVTFTYAIGAHLMATCSSSSADAYGNAIYYYQDFAYESGGRMHTETYNYEESGEIDSLITDGYFSMYVSGDEGNIPNFINDYGYARFAFITGDKDSAVTMDSYGAEYEKEYLSSSYSVSIPSAMNYTYMPCTRDDRFAGLTYPPYVRGDVFIRRGNASPFERFFKLTDIKTMEDLERYSNGSEFLTI